MIHAARGTAAVAAGWLLAVAVAAVACAPADPDPPATVDDPAIHDPREVDPAEPPSMVGVRFRSAGAVLNGQLYTANGPGPHPTIVLLHGFPGHEKNLDLAQAARRAGYNVLFFHYRGAWGSEGTFGFRHVVEDVGAALAWLREQAEVHRVDRERLIPIGHSMGGFAALAGAARDPGVGCVAALAPWNLSAFARELDGGGEEARGRFAASLEAMTELNVPDGAAVVSEIVGGRDDFDPTRMTASLAGKSVLVVGASDDRVLPRAAHYAPLVAAYSGNGDVALTGVMLSGDHAFSWSRIALIATVLDWLEDRCASTGRAEAINPEER